MSEHQFKVGDLVHLQDVISPLPGERLLDKLPGTLPAGTFAVVRLLPELITGQPQYRIRYETDGHERVVRESQIAHGPHPQPRR